MIANSRLFSFVECTTLSKPSPRLDVPRRAVKAMLLKLVVATALVMPTAVGAVPVRTVALSSDPAPGASANFIVFQAPFINGNGQAAFVGVMDDLDATDGLWSEGGGSLAKVALQTDAAPGTSLSLGSFQDANIKLYLNDAGQAAFGKTLSDFNTGGAFSQTGAGNALRKIAAGGDAAPGTNDPTRLYQTGFGAMGGFNNSGRAAFHASMPPTAGPPGNFASSGTWSEGSGTLNKLAEVGDSAPGTAAVFDQFRIPAINNGGHAAFVAAITSGGAGEGVWTNRSGSLARLVGNGDSAPGGGTFSILFNDTVAINDTGDIVFSANLVGGTVPDGIWVARNGGIEKVVLEGDVAPGSGGHVYGTAALGIESAFLGLDANGNAAFTSYLDDGRRGLFSEGLGALHAVALSGDVAPGTGGLTYQGVLKWTLNESGQTAFIAQLSNFTDAIFAEDILGTVHKIVLPGDMLEVAPGDFREVAQLSFLGLDGSAGVLGNNVTSGFGANGDLAFMAEFTDGSSGVFVTTVPELASWSLMAAGCMLWPFCHRRRPLRML